MGKEDIESRVEGEIIFEEPNEDNVDDGDSLVYYNGGVICIGKITATNAIRVWAGDVITCCYPDAIVLKGDGMYLVGSRV